MIKASSLALRRGAQLLFSGADFAVHAGQRVGLTGANGSGKSSLLAMLRGELDADAGSLSWPASWAVAHVAQESEASNRAALAHAIDGDAALRALQAQCAAAETAGEGERHAALLAELEAAGLYSVEARAAQMLAGLGFAPADLQRPVRDFSGGWRMRLNLAQALMCRSDLLLLDEPTNHLDLDAVLWLEQWLRSYPGTLLLISHDREFLDAVVGDILHIERGALGAWRGNYSEFERQRAAKLAAQQAAHAAQQRQIAHMASFVERFRAKASKARQAQSRLKALQRMGAIEAANIDSPFAFRFADPPAIPQRMLALEAVALGHGEVLVEGLTLALQAGDRVGLIGPNGAGKSTLIKTLAGELAPLAGSRQVHEQTRIGYFAQHQLDQLRPERSPLQHLSAAEPAATEQTLRDHLGRFGFHGERVFEPVAPFSGGEKARLVLALLVRARPNLLLLDEPSNHLDLQMRQALARALQDFDGAVVMIAHDRHLLRVCCDRLLLLSGGRAEPFAEDLDGYASWLRERRRAAPPLAAALAAAPLDKREQRRQQARQRAALAPLRRAVEAAEAALEKAQASARALAQQLADPALYQGDSGERLQALLREQGAARAQLTAAESDWLAAMEALEAAEEPGAAGG